MFNLKKFEIIEYTLYTLNINIIGLWIVGLKIHFHSFIYYINSKYFNTKKSIWYAEKSVFSQVIILNKSKMTWQKNLMTVILNIRHNQAIEEISNAGLQSMKVLTIINI